MFFLCGGCEVSLAVEGLFANMSYLRGQFSTVCVLKIALWWAPVLKTRLYILYSTFWAC